MKYSKFLDEDLFFMSLALKESLKAFNEGEVPIGAIAVLNKKVIAKSYNKMEQLKTATAHAELILISKVSSIINNWRLNDVIFYVTKEPCAMCAGAMVNARLEKLVFGIKDPNYGAAGSVINVTRLKKSLHKIDVVSGIMESQCLEILHSFFKKLRIEKNSKTI